MLLFYPCDAMKQRRYIGKSFLFGLRRKGGINLFEFRALIIGRECEIFLQSSKVKRIACV